MLAIGETMPTEFYEGIHDRRCQISGEIISNEDCCHNLNPIVESESRFFQWNAAATD